MFLTWHEHHTIRRHTLNNRKADDVWDLGTGKGVHYLMWIGRSARALRKRPQASNLSHLQYIFFFSGISYDAHGVIGAVQPCQLHDLNCQSNTRQGNVWALHCTPAASRRQAGMTSAALEPNTGVAASVGSLSRAISADGG
jgi:hypothetical protein